MLIKKIKVVLSIPDISEPVKNHLYYHITHTSNAKGYKMILNDISRK